MADERQGRVFLFFVMRAPATNTHVTRVSRLKTRAPQSGHRTCTPATNTAQTPKTDPTLTPTRQSPGNPAPPCRIQRTVVSCVLCADLSCERASHIHRLLFVPAAVLFVVPAASCLQTMVSSSPIVRVKSLVFLLASSLPSAFVCVCAHSPCHAIHYQPVARGLQLRPTALLNHQK